MVAITVFLAATLLFIGLFNQTIQTAVIYQRHKAISTKCSDLLDSMLLNPGTPVNWGQSNYTPTGFGLQDPEFTQYNLSPFSLMRLASSAGQLVYYQKTGLTYSNITMGFGNYLLMPYKDVANYSLASRLLGINNTYGFQLTLTPVITVSIAETQNNPLRLSVNATGTGFPLANAPVSYRLIPVFLNGTYPDYARIQSQTGTVYTDEEGSASVAFPLGIDENLTYAFVAYAHLGGLVGMGYYEHVSSQNQHVIPLVDDLSEGKVILAHSNDVPYTAGSVDSLKYNATFVFLNEDFQLQEVPLENSYDTVTSSAGYPYGIITVPNYNPGILVVAYSSATAGGVVMMPWGLGSLAFPVTFGGDPSNQEWVATDMRQVTVNGIAYQAKLSLWSLEGYQVNG
jgi:hypothetical protein